MISFLLGGTWGFVGGVYFYAWIVKRAKKQTKVEDPIETTVEKFVQGEKGGFIKVNKVENYIKEHQGEEIKLSDVIDDI